MMTAKFTNKEEYLQYRKEWKAEYKQLSNEIRENKKDMKDVMRHNEYAGGIQSCLIRQRYEATTMLEQLKDAKAEAQRQYLSDKTKKEELISA